MARRTRTAAAGASGDDLRRIALGLPDAVETLTWGEPHFRIHNKIFCGLGVRDGREVTSVKLGKGHAEARLLDPRFRPAPYVGRYGWVEVALEDVTPEELAALLEESYRLVAKRKRGARSKLGRKWAKGRCRDFRCQGLSGRVQTMAVRASRARTSQAWPGERYDGS